MPETRYRPRRSMIFAPGNKPRMWHKALDTGADMVCIDLEDAVAPGRQGCGAGRRREHFPRLRAAARQARKPLVRINSLHSLDGLKDVAALADLPEPPAGFMLAKVKSIGEVAMLDDVLSEAGAVSVLHVMIETNEALGPGLRDRRGEPAGALPDFRRDRHGGRPAHDHRLGESAVRPFPGRSCRGGRWRRPDRRALARSGGHGRIARRSGGAAPVSGLPARPPSIRSRFRS